MGAPFADRQCVVTGAAGFIGSNLCRRLVAEGFDVTGVDIVDPEPEREIAGVDYLVSDVRKTNGAWAQEIADADFVFHLAADMGGVGYFHTHDFKPPINNARMTMNVIEACAAANARLFYASSACAYPTGLQQTPGNAPPLVESALENDAGGPDLNYGREKLAGLRLCEAAPFDARVGILHTVFGPLQERSGERMKFPTAVATKALTAVDSGEPLVLWGDGSQLRSYLFIDDAIEKIMAVMFSDYAGPVNIGAQGAVTCREIARLCLSLVGAERDHPIKTDPTQPTGVVSRDCSNTKFRNTYGIDPQRSYAAGFSALIDWLRSTPNH